MREHDEIRFESYIKKRRGTKLWQKVVGSLMCVVVFCTTYALILPAVTEETDTYCGYEEHIHEESCYQAAETAPPELICQLEETAAHVHGEECYLPAHTHGEECYRSEQVLVCETAEAGAHVHSAECYATETPLVCGQEESQGHAHSEGCYAETATALTCTLAETEGHIHSDACSTTTGGELICGQEESDEHTHDAACYSETVTTLTCTLEEAEAHAHTDACYTTTGGELTCTTEESAGHTHDETCNGESVETLVCTLEETEGHIHAEACYTAGEPVLVCELEERAEAELICTTEEAEGHTHSEECYASSEATVPAEGVLVCELEEHTHDLTCHANPNADIENASDWEATFADVELSGVWADDLLAIAETQLGYQESTKNYIVLEDGETTKGYTRYGAWYGDPYGDWCAMFVSFCLHYAQVPEEAIPQHHNCAQWIETLSGENWNLYTPAEGYTPVPGDLIFFDQDGDGVSDHVGLVQALSGDGLTTIEGNSGNRVKTNTYSLNDGTILGYGTLPKQQVTEEDAAVNEVIAMIDAMPSADEIDARLAEYEEAEDYEGEEAYYTEVCQEVNTVYQAYSRLTPEQQAQVTNADKLMELEYIWSAATLDDPVMNADGTYDLEQFLHKIVVMHNGENTNGWEEIDYGADGTGEVQYGDALRFRLEYQIPRGTLDENHRTITYQLQPPLNAVNEETGYVYNEDGNQVGTYVIDATGLITITFYEEYAKENKDGLEIAGYITFETSVDRIDSENSDDISIPLGDQTINLHITDKTFETADLQVDKTAGNVDLVNGTVDYTIKVTSENGTGSKVTLNDAMTNVKATSDIVVKDKNGNTVNVTPTVDNNGNFTLDLPQMNAGDSYTITYSAQLNNADTLNGTVTGTNQVDVTSTNRDGNVLVDEDTVTTQFSRDIISKSGALNEAGDTIDWTIVVNSSELDIDGWTLSDTLSGSAYTGTVTITPNPNSGTGSLTTNLPYTFPSGSHDVEYTITYSTSVSGGSLGSSTVTNTGTMTPGNGTGVSSGVQIGTGTYNPLDKAASGVILNGREDENGNKLADYTWTVTISADEGPLEPYAQTISGQQYTVWYYGDELWNEASHWMTGTQIKAMAEALKANYSGRFEILAYVWNGGSGKYQNTTPLAQVTDSGKYGQFRILFYDTLPQGGTITFTYSSTGQVGNGTASKELTNWGTVNNQVSDQASQTYRPVVTKVDKNGSGSSTEHNINDSKLTFKDGAYTGVLGWNVNVTLPSATYTEDVIITEDIPDGTELLDDASGQWALSFSLSGFSNEDFNFNSNGEASITKTVDGVKYTVTAKKDNGKYIITIPAAMANKFAGNTISMEVRVQIDKGLNWDQLTKAFKNTVTVTTGNTELGEASQTQNIRNPVIDKSIGAVDENIIPYSLEINPSGQDLLEGEETLTLTDVLSFAQPSGSTVNAVLLVDTVKVYQVAGDGTQTDITAQCPYTFNETGADGKTTKTITMTIPDSTHLIVAYNYRISGTVGTSVQLDNAASLEGFGKHLDEDDADYKVTIQDSKAGAILMGIKLIKVDAENFSMHLKGATFSLEKWNGTAYEEVGKYVSDENGTISSGELQTDVAYRFVEIDAPDGYLLDPEPYEFYVTGTGTLSAPANFAGHSLNNGDSVIFANTKAAYTLPETGGIGTIPYTTAGLLTMLGSGILLSRNKRRRKGGSAE